MQYMGAPHTDADADAAPYLLKRVPFQVMGGLKFRIRINVITSILYIISELLIMWETSRQTPSGGKKEISCAKISLYLHRYRNKVTTKSQTFRMHGGRARA